MPVPDPALSRAVLIGIGTYTHPDLKLLPAAESGARQLAVLLRDSTIWGLPPEHVTELGAEASAEQVLDAVYRAAGDATDTLLVYFAGHGLRDRDERLYLALAGANADQPEIGTVHYPTLRNVLRQSGYRARFRITVLDCCYSGLAGAMSTTTAPTRTDLARALDERPAEQADDTEYGDCVLTSAPPTKPSFAPPEAAFPEFTGELINILENGIKDAGPTLSMDDVWQRVRHRLRERGSPEPQQFAQNKVARQVHLRNRASALGGSPSPDASALHPSAEQEITAGEQQAVLVRPAETAIARVTAVDQPAVIAREAARKAAATSGGRLRSIWGWMAKDHRSLLIWVGIFFIGLAVALTALLWPRGDNDTPPSGDSAGEEWDEPVDEGPTPEWSLGLSQPLHHRPVLDGPVGCVGF